MRAMCGLGGGTHIAFLAPKIAIIPDPNPPLRQAQGKQSDFRNPHSSNPQLNVPPITHIHLDAPNAQRIQNCRFLPGRAGRRFFAGMQGIQGMKREFV